MNAKPEKKKDETNDLLGEDQSLEPVSPKNLAQPDIAKAPGTESIEGGDTTFPRYRLLQNTSAEVENNEEKAGVFKHSLTEESFEEKEIIPLCLLKTRVMFNVDDRKGAPVCRSVDLKHGSGCDCGCNNVCAQCKYQKWQNGMPPECSLVYNYPCLTPDEIGKTAMPTLISFMKASTQAALKMNTVVQGTLPPMPFWHTVWKISSAAKKFKKGTAYIINLKKVRDATDEEKEWCEKVYQHCIAGRSVDVEYDEGS
jgi:hypothetical protein